MRKWIFSKRLLTLLAVSSLVACTSSRPAPIIDAWHQSSASRYRVQSGDTLYSVAFAFGFDYRDIALVNHLKFPYAIKVGDYLTIKKPSKKRQATYGKRTPSPTKKAAKSHHYWVSKKHKTVVNQHKMTNPKQWRWPVKSKLLQRFTGEYGRSQGVDFAGWKGRSIFAAAPGRVVYSGTGVRGYGNLVIIKHSEEYLSAYAYASRRFVHAGEWVKAGQRVAAMGQDSYGRVRLHFELRRNGKPVDPLQYLH